MDLNDFEINIPKHMNFMEVKIKGVIELETLRALSSEADKFANMFDEKPKIIKVLTDVTEVKKVSIHSRKYGSKWAANHPEFRIAFYGQSLFLKYILNLVITINKTSKSMKLFNSKATSIDWLNKN